MTEEEEAKRFIVSTNRLPAKFPTNRHEPEFWEALGRAVATFGFLEETLGKAIFSFSGTKKLEEQPSQEEFQAWFRTLERALSDTLSPLIESYASAVRKHGEATITNLDDLVTDLKKVAEYRNVICHGSWRPPNSSGQSVPFFVTRKQKVFESALDAAFLKQLQIETAKLSCEVVNTVTHMGFQFPGSNGPGKPIWQKSQEANMTKTFGAKSTTDEVLQGIDLSGKRVLVTGASAGLGVETARVLAAHGATVIGAVRDLDKGRKATEIVRKNAANGGSLELIQLDLASLKSVRACADALVKTGKPFDVVICNAGVMACPQGKTADGFETQFGTNHLGHFVLVNRIASLLHKGSRLVNLSSAGHRFSDVDIDDPNFEHTPYTEFGAYGRSKTANILFAVEFDRRHKGEGVRATAVHPGGIQTELGRYMTPDLIQNMIKSIEESNKAAGAPAFEWKTIPQGAATTVWSGFVAPADQVGGLYCEDCHVAELRENPQARGGVRAYALDPERAKALWALSEKMVGETF